MEINLLLPSDQNFIQKVKELGNTIERLAALPAEESHSLILDENLFSSPLAILPIAALISEYRRLGRQISIKKVYDPSPQYPQSYFDYIKFPEGINSSRYLSQNKTYIPIIAIPNNSLMESEKNQVLYELRKLINHQFNAGIELIDSLAYPIQELSDNVWQHSDSSHGWLLAQYYTRLQSLEVSILDTGLGILNKYRQTGTNLKNDREAIEQAVTGLSSKKAEGNRGYGLPSTIKLVVTSPFKGQFIIISGNAFYYKDQAQEILEELPYSWQGTIIGLRIKQTEKIDLYQYIE